MRRCQCDFPIIDWEAPDCEGNCRRCGGDLSHTLTAPLVEEAEYLVRFTLTIPIAFAPIERPTPLTEQDAIDNAHGTVRDGLWDELRNEGWTIETTAERNDMPVTTWPSRDELRAEGVDPDTGVPYDVAEAEAFEVLGDTAYTGKVDGTLGPYRHATLADAEAWVAAQAEVDPEGVERGDYYIDAGHADETVADLTEAIRERVEQTLALPRRHYYIVHSFTDEVVMETEATCPVDALAAYSLAEGFADPRETARELRTPADESGSGEGDYFYLQDDGNLGMTFTNYAVHAVERKVS